MTLFCAFLKRKIKFKGGAPVIKRNQKTINMLNMLSDACLIFISYFISLFIRFIILDGIITVKLWSFSYSVIIGIYSVLVVLVYYGMKMYGSYRFKDTTNEAINIFLINGVLISILTTFLFVFKINEFSRLVLFLYWLISSFLVITKRAVVRSILKKFRKLGYNQKHVIIMGNGKLALKYTNDIKRNPQVGVTIDGYISAVQKKELGTCLGSYEELEKILATREIDELIIALEPHEVRFMKYAIACADKEGIRLSLIPFFSEYFPSHATMSIIGDSKLIDMRATPLDKFLGASLKRSMDIFGSIFGIILLSPVMLITALGVKFSSPGPILFRQDRIGLHKKPFKMLKFRSMRVNEKETTGWSKNVDTRKTRFGSFIRKFSIDELPQLFNVLKGDMSLVGPRPEIPFYVQQFKEDVPLYLVRQQVRPGMTGWAQIHGLRGDTSIEERVKYDIWYIENWSLALDIKILFKTVFGGIVNNEVIVKKQRKQ